MNFRPGILSRRCLRSAATIFLLLFALLLAACSTQELKVIPQRTTTLGVTLPPVHENAANIRDTHVSGKFGSKPEVSNLPSQDSIKNVERKILKEGDGPVITPDDTLAIKFSSYDLETGKKLMDYAPGTTALNLKDSGIPPEVVAALTGIKSNSRVSIAIPKTKNNPARLFVIDAQKVENGVSANGRLTNSKQNLVDVSGIPGGAPIIRVRGGKPLGPRDQLIEPILQGKGAVVKDRDVVTVQYAGYLYAEGTKIESTWDTPKQVPAVWSLDEINPKKPGGLIHGLRNAVIGQRVGSRILTIFGPELGFGNERREYIPPNSTLVYVIDIVNVL